MSDFSIPQIFIISLFGDTGVRTMFPEVNFSSWSAPFNMEYATTTTKVDRMGICSCLHSKWALSALSREFTLSARKAVAYTK